VLAPIIIILSSVNVHEGLYLKSYYHPSNYQCTLMIICFLILISGPSSPREKSEPAARPTPARVGPSWTIHFGRFGHEGRGREGETNPTGMHSRTNTETVGFSSEPQGKILLPFRRETVCDPWRAGHRLRSPVRGYKRRRRRSLIES
jgi:hypothetical protein